MKDERPIGLLRDRWEPALIVMIGWSLLAHAIGIGVILVVVSRSAVRDPAPVHAYTVELASIGPPGANAIPGRPGADLRGGPVTPPESPDAVAPSSGSGRPPSVPDPPTSVQGPAPAAVPKPPSAEAAPIAVAPATPAKPAPPRQQEEKKSADAPVGGTIPTQPVKNDGPAKKNEEPIKKTDAKRPPVSSGDTAAVKQEKGKPVKPDPGGTAAQRRAPQTAKTTGDRAKASSKTDQADKKPQAAAKAQDRDTEQPKPGSPARAHDVPPSKKPAGTTTSATAQGATGDATDAAAEGSRPEEARYAAAIDRIRRHVEGNGGGLGGDGDPRGLPSVGGQGPGAGDRVVGAEFLIYYNIMIAHIKQAWLWVGHDQGLVVTVRFAIGPEGEIGNVELGRSSGDLTYDESVLRAVRRASPLPPPPPAYERDFRRVELTFRPGDLRQPG